MNNYSNPVTVTGNPASFEASGNGKLLSLSVPFSPIQSGSGNPSPDNVRPISGLTGLSVYVSPTTAQADATTYAVDWNSEAGTVYGGTLEVVTGVLTVDRAYKAFDGTEDWGIVNGAYFMTVVGTLNSVVNDSAISTHYLDNPNISTGNYQLGFRCYNRSASPYTGAAVLVRPEAPLTTSLSDFKAWLVTQNTNGTPFAVCYELATPLTYQLTPTQVELLIGQNNVWSDSNEAVTLTYVIELFTRYTFIVNGNDYTGLVERDSYRTAVTPVYGETIQTLDGVGHTALLRVKGSLTVKLNPQTAAQTAAICADLLNAPCEVQYKCLQRNVNVTALMVLDVVSAMFLSRCLYLGQKWNDVDEIVLKEL